MSNLSQNFNSKGKFRYNQHPSSFLPPDDPAGGVNLRLMPQPLVPSLERRTSLNNTKQNQTERGIATCSILTSSFSSEPAAEQRLPADGHVSDGHGRSDGSSRRQHCPPEGQVGELERNREIIDREPERSQEGGADPPFRKGDLGKRFNNEERKSVVEGKRG